MTAESKLMSFDSLAYNIADHLEKDKCVVQMYVII